ncbi:MAG: hypothetical protein ACSHX5_10755 [Phycisphaerales bacterium]
MPRASKKTHTPICPKCGYDQSGTIATWKNQCPTQGLCNECGINFQWSDIFDPSRTNLPWYTEHARSLSQLITRTLPTFLRLINPKSFWKQVHPTTVIKLKPLVLWFILLSLAAHILVSAINMYSFYAQHAGTTSWYWTNFKAGGVYAYPELALNTIFKSVFDFRIHQSNTGIDSIKVNFAGWNIFSTLFLRPLSASLGFNIMWLLVLLVIPTTRRLAKIRKAHICRAFILSLISTLLILQLTRLHYQYRMNSWRVWNSGLGFKSYLNLILIWQLLFWIAAIKSWKIKSPKLLIALGTTAALLFALFLNTILFIIPDLVR